MIHLSRLIPAIAWLQSYQKANFRGDLTAGLTTAVMLIPQGMAYSMLAGLPPIMGLYASTIPILVYSLLGTSRQLAVGPVAMVSLLTAAGVGTLAAGGTEAYIAYAVLLALIVGVLQFGMGIARLGMLTNFLSHPILAGFTSAAAIIIASSQLKHLMGVKLEGGHNIVEILLEAGTRIGDTHPITLLIGVVSIITLVLLKKYRPTWPRAIFVVLAGTLTVWIFGLHNSGVGIVGDVPAGLPAFQMPEFSMDAFQKLFPMALTIALVSFMESIAVAKKIAQKHRYEVDPNQELIALGGANIAGSFFQSFTVTGGFSRTAVNDQSGAKTPLAALITAGIIAITLLFLTDLFYFLPRAVLAAIIMTAVFGLIDFHEARHLWKVERTELTIMAITFVATLGIGIEQGILIGAGASLLWFMYKTTKPHVAVLGKLPDRPVYRNIDRFDEVHTIDGLLALRIDSQFYYGNVTFLKDTLNRLEREMDVPLQAVVLDGSGINELDSSAETALRHIVEEYHERHIAFYIACAKGPVRDMMRRASLWNTLGDDHITYTVHDAVCHALEHHIDVQPDAAPIPLDQYRSLRVDAHNPERSPFASPEKMPTR